MGDVTIAQMLLNFEQSFPALVEFIRTFAMIAGYACAVIGLWVVYRANDDQSGRSRATIAGGLWSIVAGVLLIFAMTTIKTIAHTAFGASTSNALDYISSPNVTGNTGLALRAFVQIFGFIAFTRGIFVLRAVGMHGEGGPRTFWRGALLVLGGVAAIHIIDFLGMLSRTFGAPALMNLLGG